MKIILEYFHLNILTVLYTVHNVLGGVFLEKASKGGISLPWENRPEKRYTRHMCERARRDEGKDRRKKVEGKHQPGVRTGLFRRAGYHPKKMRWLNAKRDLFAFLDSELKNI